MIFQILDNLRSKPKHVRDQYALGIAVFCTLAIGGVWTLSLPARFAPQSQVAALASTTTAAPFSNFITQLKNQFVSVKSAIDVGVATSSQPLSAASSTEAALELTLSKENKDQINASSTGEAYTAISFGNGSTSATTSVGTSSRAVLVGTSSTDGAPAR